MSLRINHNIQAMNGHRNLTKNEEMISKSLERLSSGLRINRGADGAAGLIVSEQMRAQIRGTDQAIANSQDGVSLVQTAEGALDEVNTLLNKGRALALHSLNEGANDQSQLIADQTELDNIISSVDRLATNTQFGNKKLLDGSQTSFRSNSSLVGAAQTGNHYANGLAAGTITRGYHSLSVTTEATQGNLFLSGGTTDIITGGTLLAMSGLEQFQKAFTVSINGSQLNVASGQTKTDFITSLNAMGRSLGFVAVTTTMAAAAASYSGTSVSVGTGTNIVLVNNNFGSTSTLTMAFVGGNTGATSLAGTYTAGTDMVAVLYLNSGAVGTTASSGSTTVALTQTGSSLTLVSSAANGYRISLNAPLSATGSIATGTTGFYAGVIDGMNSGATFQIGANVGQRASVDLVSSKANDLGNGASSSYTSLGSLNGSLTSGNANEALKVIDKAITDVTLMRGKLGAFQANTLETNISSLRTASENLTTAESNIRDVDFAAESANFTKYNILVQSATAMLAQANQLPQGVLKLLG